jgi:hypothetical protein
MVAPAPVRLPALRRFVLRQSRLGTFSRCLIFFVMLAILGAYCFAWYRDRFFNQLRNSADATPLVQPNRVSIEGDIRLFQKRWREFTVAKPGDAAVFDLTEDDIRTLLRARSSLADRSEIRLSHDQVNVMATFPLAEIPYFGERFNDRFLNVTATLTATLVDGIPRITISKATIGGNPVTEEQRKYLELLTSAWLANALVPQREILARVKQMRIENGVIYLQQ